MKENSPEIFISYYIFMGKFLSQHFVCNVSGHLRYRKSADSLDLNLQMNLKDKFQALQQVSEVQIHLKLSLKGLFPRKHKTFVREIKRAN